MAPDVPGGPIEVRSVRPAEHAAAGAIVVAAYEALPGNHMTGGYAAELSDVTRRLQGAEVLVAMQGEEMVGCVTFVPDADSEWAEDLREGESSVRMLGVDPSKQRLGIGQLLLDACVEQARDRGSSAIFLHTTPWMKAAHRLYERNGFVRVTERDWLPIPEVPLIAYRLDLGRAHR